MLLCPDIQDRQAQAEKLKQTLQQAMDNAESAQFETGRVTFKRSKDATLLDVDRLLLDHPELVAAYAACALAPGASGCSPDSLSPVSTGSPHDMPLSERGGPMRYPKFRASGIPGLYIIWSQQPFGQYA